MIASFRIWLSKAFNTSILEKDRRVWVDYLRGIIIILVVYHHTFLGIGSSGISVSKTVIDVNMAAYSFRMPLFFIFSGIFTGLSLSSKSIRTILKSKFNLILYPYLVWSFLQITLKLIFSDYTNSDSTLAEYLYIFYQPKQLAQFWYLPALFNSTMIFVLIKSKFNIKPEYHLLLGIVFFLIAPFVSGISMISNWMRFYIFLVLGDNLSQFILKEEIKNKLQRIGYFLVAIPFFIAAQYYYFNYIGVRSLENDATSFALQTNFGGYVFNELSFLLTSIIGCTTFIFFAFLLEKWNCFKWLRVIGFHSLYIYIMHVIIVAFMRMILTKFFGADNYIVILLTGIFFGVTIPVIFYNLIGKKYLWFLFSPKKYSSTEIKTRTANRSSEIRLRPMPTTSVNNI
jgi:fucose 4-O-acetylase-like acetyltransferase